MQMSEAARLSVLGSDMEDAATAAASFERFFERERDELYRTLCLVTRNHDELTFLGWDGGWYLGPLW